MRKILLSAVAVAALSATAPASAQVGGIIEEGINSLLGGGAQARIERLGAQIDQAYQRGEITRAAASTLHQEYLQLRQLELQYRQGGLSRDERSDLQRRINRLEQRLQIARSGAGYDRDDRDNRYGRNACPPGLAKKNNGCMPPGQAKKRGDIYDDRLGSVPSSYGNRYRDTDRYFYRYDGNGRIYQVDRRTGRIVNVIQVRR
jgi:hypothetical protein